ncbi:hypothetical protein FJY90_03065, partial [Candidatus Gottesmanbacteria bacterium]|nr:hypothetical protein [Candidatus Gottesmanbacteria bacterium]
MGKKQIFSLIVFLIILGGLVLRSINLRNIQFNWDQEYLLAFPAKDIIYNHHFPLIGARTGTGDLNIGPLYSYLAAMTFFVFRMDPIAAPILAMLLSYITIIFSLILVRRVFGPFAAGYFICLWCVSPFVISLDRIPWNVNLLPISSVLTACGLWLVMKKEKLLGWFLAGSGLLVGVNSHFSVCFFLVIVLTVSLINKKMVDKSIIWTVFILGLSLVPLILFNFRHNQLLKQNFTKFVVSAVISYNELPNRLIYISSITLETIGRVILFEGSSWIQQSLAIFFMVLLIILRNDPKIKVYLRIFCIYLLIYILGFTLYKGPTPDYYYLGLVVVSTIGFALVFSKIKDKFPETILLLLLICFILSYKSYILVGKPESYSLAVKQQIIETVKKYSDNQPVFLNLDMELGHSFGYD